MGISSIMDSTMKIGVISDTHGDIDSTRQALEILDRFRVGMTLHCGDVGPDVIPLLSGRRVHFVAGNMDNPDDLREAIIQPEHTLHEGLGTLEIEGRRVAFLHGHDVGLLHHTIDSGHWDLVCHGHTHVSSSGREGSTLVVNPGALSRTRFPSIAVIDLPSLEVTEVPL
jgi:uncharacterized protein